MAICIDFAGITVYVEITVCTTNRHWNPNPIAHEQEILFYAGYPESFGRNLE